MLRLAGCIWLSLSLAVPVAAAVDEQSEAEAAESDASVSVEIDGIDDPLLTNVRRFLGIVELESGFIEQFTGDDDPEPVTEAEILRRHRAAPGEIRQALMPYGYYQPVIETGLEKHDGSYTAHYDIDPGPPAELDRVTVDVVGEGSDFPALREALAEVEIEPGDRLVHPRYEAAKTALYDAAYDHGFLDAAWQASEIRVAPDRRSADIELVLDTGPRFYFGETSIRQDVLARDFIRGFVDIREGEPYDVEQLLELQRALSETDYFSRVEVQAPREAAGPDHRVPVRVITEPAKAQRYTVGLGYGTDTGPRMKLGVVLRRLNAWGHRMRADIQVSAIERAIGTRYEIPIRDYEQDLVTFSATGRREEIGDADTEQISLGASHLVDWLGFRRSLYVQAEREQFSFGDGPNRETDLVYPGVTLSRERVDDIQYPRRGYGIRVDLRAGVENLMSEVSFSRLELSGGWTRAIASRTRLLLRADAGILWTDHFSELPPSQRFFAGGDQSIRGYAFRDVGPRNADDDVIGGERMVAASVELEHLFYRDYGGAVFVDAGDAFDASPDVKVGAGVGFRWRSPIGMLRFDVAHPFDGPDNFRIHLTLGAEL